MIFMTLYLAPRATAQRRTEREAQRVERSAPGATASATEVAAAAPATAAAPAALPPPVPPQADPAALPTPEPAPEAGAARSPPAPVVPAEPPAPAPAEPPAPAPAPAPAVRPPLPAPVLVTRFSTGSAALSAGQLAQIEGAARALRRHPELRASVRGHADARGSDTENTPLSEERAAAVTAALRARGVEAERLQTLGSGSQNPLDEAETTAALARNRRVEIVFTWKDTP
jgi:outer membrane protein OmpA-like peptidoglycan-associated protein